MIDEFGIDHLGRPCRDLYCMNLCFEIARKSLDPYSKNGCFVIGETGEPVTAGYNSPVQDSVDEETPLTRPEKYIYFEHAERNAIYLAARKGRPLENTVFYTTGFPCVDCMRGMMQVKAKKIIYGPQSAMQTDSEEYIRNYNFLLKGQKIVIQRFIFDEGLYRFNPRIRELMKDREVANINFEWNTKEMKNED